MCAPRRKRVRVVGEVSEKKSLNARRLHLTYKGHLDFKELLAFLQRGGGSAGREIRQYSMVHENGHSNGDVDYAHTHVAVWFKRRVCWSSARRWDVGSVHPNIRIVNSDDDWLKVIEYHKKEPVGEVFRSEELGAYSQSVEVDKVLSSCKTWREVIRKKDMEGYVRSGNMYAWLRDMWSTREMRIGDPLDGRELYPWQVDMMSKLSGVPDSRKIYWLCDVEGGKGKSCWARRVLTKMGNVNVMVFSTSTDAKHAANQIVSCGVKRVYILDSPRANGSDIPYALLEDVKNGVVQSSMYQGEILLMEVPHVVVLSNSLPQQRMLSADRYVVYKISEKFELEDVTVTVNDRL